MTNTVDLMVDIETLDVTPTSVILTIGAKQFDPRNPMFEGDSYYTRVDIDEQTKRTVNESTVEWWEKQKHDSAHEALVAEPRLNLHDALEGLACIAAKCEHIWANGIAFDIAILEDAMREQGVDIPWKFWNVMDARTIYKIVPSVKRATNSHNALEDCCNQIIQLQQCFQQLGLVKKE